MKKQVIMLLLVVLIVLSFKTSRKNPVVIPPNWPALHYDFKNNPVTSEKAELGRMLFYDPILSANNTISCASCHSQYTAFAHVDHALSHGIYDRIGTRNAPALMNLAWQTSYMWDGAINYLDMQALAPISHHDEMNESIEHVVEKLQQSNSYKKLFYKAYNDSVITGEYTLKAISQFMLTLVSCNSKYDSVMNQQTVFTSQEKNGYRLFQQHCSSCHAEPLFTNGKMENNGLPVDTSLNDTGRMKVTLDSADMYKFKVPTLRNIEFSAPYMHDGRFKKLSEVINHYINGIEYSKTLAAVLQNPVTLTPNEKVDLVAFLLTLTDKKFLFNPEYGYMNSIKTQVSSIKTK